MLPVPARGGAQIASPKRKSSQAARFLFTTFLIALGWPAAGLTPLSHDVVFVSRQFRGISGRYDQIPFDNQPDVESNLYKLTTGGGIVQLTDLYEYDGGALDPDISWDATKILFSMRRHRWEGWHIWEMNVDGSGLRQVTFDGPGLRCNDLEPIYLSEPGKFAFISDRIGGADEGSGGTASNLFIGDLDTGEVRPIDFNPSGSAGPVLGNDGSLLFSRWERMRENNRGSVWRCNQDGTGMNARWGQYGTPAGRLIAGYDLQQAPGNAAAKFLGILTNFGDTAGDLGYFSMTDYLRDPEGNPPRFPSDGLYQTPIFVDANRVLYSFDPFETSGGQEDFGLYLDSISMDARTLVYNATQTHEIDPVLVRPRTPPPQTGGELDLSKPTGRFVCDDVTLRGDCRQPCALTPGLGDPNLAQHLALGVPALVRVFKPAPRRATWLDVTVGGPDLGTMGEQSTVAGYVPVAADGSVAIDLPAGEAYSLQILDQDGVAIAQDRSWLWTQPGETVNCKGCHVPRNNQSFPIRNEGATPAALSSPANLSGTSQKPLTFIADIHPVFAAKCIGCHAGAAPSGGLDLTIGRKSYSDLLAANFGRVPSAYIQMRSARNSFLYQLLVGDAFGQSDHQTRLNAINAGVNHTTMLSPSELTTLLEWLDTEPSFAYLAGGLVEGPPRIQQVIPRPGTQGAPTNSPVEILFSEGVNPDQRLLNSFSLVRTSDGAPVSGVLLFPREDVLRFRPSAPLESLTAYTISLSTDIQDLQGNSLEAPFSSQFTTGTTPDPGPPSVVWVTPNTPGAALPVTGPIRVGFSEKMSPGSLRRDQFRLLDEIGEEQSFLFRLNDDRTVVQIAPFPPLASDSFYTLIVDGDVADSALNPMGADHTTQFRTPASRPPSALTVNADSYDLPSWEFDGQDILLSGDRLWTYGLDWERSRFRWFWNASRKNLHTIPVANRPISMAMSADGNRAFLVTRESRRIQVVDLIHKAVIGEATLPTDQTYQIALDPSGTKARIVSRDPDRIYTYDVNPNSANYLKMVGQANLANHDRGRTWVTIPNSIGKVYVTGNRGLDIFGLGADNVHFLERIAVNQYLNDSVATADGGHLYYINRSRGVVSVLDTASDRVIAEVPLGFGAEWDWQVADDRLALSPDERTLIAAQESTGRLWAIDRMTLDILDQIDLGKPITALVTAEGGLPGEWFVHVFLRDRYRDRSRWLTLRGPRGLDGSAPSLASSDPGSGETDVALNRTLTLNFNEPLDRHSVTTESIRVTCPTCPVPDLGTSVLLDDNNRTAHLISDGTWPLNVGLTVSVSQEVRDQSGQPLASPANFSFHTSSTVDLPYVSLVADFSMVGSDPARVNVDPEGRWILTTDYYGDSLYIHDQKTFEYVDRISVGDGPVEVLCPPGSNKAFVTNDRDGFVSVVDLNSLTESAKIQVGRNAQEMALSRDGATLYIVSAASDTVVNVNVVTNQVVGTWAPPTPGDHLFSVATSPRHNWVVAAWSTLFRFDGPAPTPITVPSNGDARILRMAVSEDGYQVYYTQQYRNWIYMTDTVTWRWTDRIPVPTAPTDLRLSPDGRFLFSVHRENGTVLVFDRFTTELVDTIAVGGDIVDMNFSADGRRFFVLRRGNPGRVMVYGVADPNDNTAPFVVGVDPYHGAPDVSANAVLRVHFSEAMDRATLGSNTLLVSGGVINPGCGELIFSKDNLTAYFVPEIPLDLGVQYQIGVETGLRDLSGNPLREPFQSQFRVVPNLVPAPGVSVGPSSNVTGTPYYVTTLTDGDPILVSNYYSNSLSFHDPETLTQGLSVNRDKRTGRAMAVDGDRAWVSYPENGELVLINVSTGQVEDTLPYGNQRRDEALSPDRTRLGAAVGGDPAFLRVTQINGSGKGVSTQTHPIWTWPRSLQFAPDNSYVYVSFYGNVGYLNLSSGKIDRSFAGWDFRQILLSPDGRTLYAVEHGGARIGVFDVATARRITSLPVGDGGEWSIALSPNGLLLAVLNYASDTIYFFDTYTNSLITTHVPGTQLQAGTFSRDGLKFYFTWDGPSNDGITALLVSNPRPAIQPSPTPTNTPISVPTPTNTPVIGPTPTPTTGTEPTMMFDVVTDGFVDSKDLLKLVGDGSMGSGGESSPMMFEFSRHWRNGQRR